MENNFATILKCLLAKKMMSNTDLATATGLSRATITHYLTGRSTPSQMRITRIAEVLEVEPYIFFDDSDNVVARMNAMGSYFSCKLKSLMDENGISQVKMAQELGTSRQTVNYYVNGKQYPSEENILKIAEILNVSREELEKPPDIKQMKVSVAKMPRSEYDCIFMGNGKCMFGGQCDLENGKCSHLDLRRNDDGNTVPRE